MKLAFKNWVENIPIMAYTDAHTVWFIYNMIVRNNLILESRVFTNTIMIQTAFGQ